MTDILIRLAPQTDYSPILSRLNSPAMPSPMQAPQPVSPTMSAPCNIWMRGWVKYQTSIATANIKRLKPAFRLLFCIYSPFTRILYAFGEVVSLPFFGYRGRYVYG